MDQNTSGRFPLQNSQASIYALSLTSGLLMSAVSALSLILPGMAYRTPELAESFLTNDLVNLLIGLPLFLAALIGYRRQQMAGLLLLPGALIYVVYNYLAYLLGQPLTWLSLAYLFLVFLAGYALFRLLRAADHLAIKDRLQGAVKERLSGGILLFFGLAFLALAVSQILAGIRTGSIPPLGEDAVAVADIVLSIGWAVGGVMLLRRQPPGYSVGLGLLVAASTLFLGLILYFFLAPLLVDRLFDWGEVITVAVMGLGAFLPAGLFWRGVVNQPGA